jgi:RNA polymerase subunit RPABC4/transcription elongation factor Spt4
VSVTVTRADARSLPLPDASVDLIVTSPPYFSLRSYTDGGEHYAGQIGSEATPREYVAALVECTREWVRVLKPSGSMFINLGDKYAQDDERSRNGLGARATGLASGAVISSETIKLGRKDNGGIQRKSLMGLPWRYALACMDDLGLILRAEIIWCLSGGARVYARTPTGDRPVMLRDLVRSYRPETVQLWNGQRWTQVLGWNRSPGRDGALELELRTGERIGCTPGHRWPTQRGVIRADEVRVGDVIQTCRLPEPQAPATPKALPLEDIGWLVGLYLAEGSRSKKMLQFAGHHREDTRHARLERIAAMYHGSAAVYRTSENGVTCNLSGAVLLGIIDHYVGRGRTARSKRLRKAVWQRQDVFLRALAEGYLEGDGHYDAKNDRWRLGFSANDELAADLRTLAARLGAKLSLRRHQHQFDGRTFPGWRGEWRWTRSVHHNAKQDGEVIAIRSSRAREFYDVGVADEPHLFALASGVLTHNSKPNSLPESVTDRVRRSHEVVFHFTRQPRYYSAVDEVREPHTGPAVSHFGTITADAAARAAARRADHGARGSIAQARPREYNPLGKLPGSVWEIPSQPLTVPAALGTDHFAAFPMELPRRVIAGWSPPGICTACGEGRRPMRGRDCGNCGALVETHTKTCLACGHRRGAEWQEARLTEVAWRTEASRPGLHSPRRDKPNVPTSTAQGGYACACPQPDAPTRPAIVADPFGGTGTTALVADALGRHGLSFDRSADYCRLARWRTTDPGERAKALQVPKPPPIMDGQDALFALETLDRP